MDKPVYALIDGIHKVLLGRPADERSLEHWSSVLAHDQGGIAELISLLLKSDEFADKIGVFCKKHLESPPFLLEKSQNQEIKKLFDLVLSDQIKHKIIVDVGANGAQGSNSYDLMRYFSWQGILIEANPRLSSRINEDFAGLNYTLVTTAVSNFAGHTNLFLGVSDGISSMHENNTSYWGKVNETIEVAVRRLPDILEEHTIPRDFGLLSIDAEGEDIKILNDTIQSGYRPQWILFEAYLPQQLTSLDGLNLAEVVKENYAFVGATHSNIFLKQKI